MFSHCLKNLILKRELPFLDSFLIQELSVETLFVQTQTV